jgi:hypothetical protein
MQTTDLIANKKPVADLDVRDRRLARLTTLLEVASMLSSELDGAEIVRPSFADERRFVFCVTWGVAFSDRSSLTKSSAS